jgi:hypothetical protein
MIRGLSGRNGTLGVWGPCRLSILTPRGHPTPTSWVPESSARGSEPMQPALYLGHQAPNLVSAEHIVVYAGYAGAVLAQMATACAG